MNRDLSVRKVQYLLETIHYLVEKSCIDSAQDIIKKTEKALREVAEGEEKKELGLSLQAGKLLFRMFTIKMVGHQETTSENIPES